MKRILAFAILAAALLSGCSPALHPAITAQVSGGTLVIGGTGFSPTNPCASLTIFYNPGTPAQTITSINKQTSCNIIASMTGNTGSFNYEWPLTPPTCTSGNATNTIPATVLAIDISTFDPAATNVTMPCTPPVAAALCPSPLLGSQLPTANWNQASSAPGYYAYQSAILSANGPAIVSQPSLGTIESAMGGVTAFKAATFNLPGTGGTVVSSGSGGGLPNGTLSCSYDSPKFTYRQQSAFAQVTIACGTGSCSSL